MSSTTVTRWGLATLFLLGVYAIERAFGHGPALAAMLGGLILIAVFGGHGRPSGSAADGGSEDGGPAGDTSLGSPSADDQQREMRPPGVDQAKGDPSANQPPASRSAADGALTGNDEPTSDPTDR